MTRHETTSRNRRQRVDHDLLGPVNRDWRKGPVLVGGKLVDLRREDSVAKQVREYLRDIGFRVLHADPGRGRLRGHNAGIPDVLSVMPGGRLLACELKRPGTKARWEAKNRPTAEDQRVTLDWLEARGALVIRCAQSVDDVRAVLEPILNGRDADVAAG
jgi:hypothetical protein